ncbi:PREDICTED: glutamic acid-rich [Prunus dulcis]|uniref:PREDICTED: glutamic acid-rich n=1 Tax=Prunus dulcis TaxID=3755 RepID=A0A5E4FM16_PRUDU|nr:PREDICTED: glutamic acid-rich [Prunus dulcis]
MKHMIKLDLDLVKLLKKFDPATNSFKFGTKSFKITADAMTEILGLLNEGKSAKLDNERYTSIFRIRHFGKAKPSKVLVEEEIHTAIALTKKSLKQKPKTKTKKTTKKSKGHHATTLHIHTSQEGRPLLSFPRQGNITLLFIINKQTQVI